MPKSLFELNLEGMIIGIADVTPDVAESVELWEGTKRLRDGGIGRKICKGKMKRWKDFLRCQYIGRGRLLGK